MDIIYTNYANANHSQTFGGLFMWNKFLKLLIFTLVLSTLLNACAAKTNSDNPKAEPVSINKSKTINITTSFYPIYIMTLNITKGISGVNVVNLTKQATGCLHDYSLTTEDMKKLQETKIFIINGVGMESFLDKAIKLQDKMKIIDSSTGIDVIRDSRSQVDNPHLWVSISNAIKQVENISTKLSLVDPLNAENYKKNAEEYIEKLKLLRDKMHQTLDGIKNNNIVTFHEAFPYFAKEFNLNIAAVVEREPNSEPSPKELVDTINIIKKLRISAIFAEPQYSAKAAHTIAVETGVEVFTLDPGVTGEENENAYLLMMEKNMQVLNEALN